jgi:hypothetical protein
MRTAAMTEHRRMFWALMEAASEAIREARSAEKQLCS